MFHSCSNDSKGEAADMGSKLSWALLAASGAVVAASAAMAAESIVYRYDSRGRLVKVERTDTATSNNVVTNYAFDKADSRTAKTTTGSPNPPPP